MPVADAMIGRAPEVLSKRRFGPEPRDQEQETMLSMPTTSRRRNRSGLVRKTTSNAREVVNRRAGHDAWRRAHRRRRGRIRLAPIRRAPRSTRARAAGRRKTDARRSTASEARFRRSEALGGRRDAPRAGVFWPGHARVGDPRVDDAGIHAGIAACPHPRAPASLARTSRLQHRARAPVLSEVGAGVAARPSRRKIARASVAARNASVCA
jgi:hypothetical protein